MADDLRALLIPPQEERLRSRFGLEGVSLRLVTSGWHRLVVTAPDRAFVFPRHRAEVPALRREAGVLTVLDLDPAPRLIGLHRDDGVSPYPFLELTRIPGTSYDAIAPSLSFEETTRCLEGLARFISGWHRVSTPQRFSKRPGHLDAPRVSEAWTRPDAIPETTRLAAESLRPHTGDAPADLWAEAILPVAKLVPTTVHGEVSDGQFLVDEALRVTGVVDWDGLHAAHPFVDLDFGVGGYRICGWERRWTEMRRHIWEAYASERGAPLPEWRCVNLFWCLLDATTLLPSGRADARWERVLSDLAAATTDLR